MALEPTTIATLPGVLPDLTQEDFDRIVARYDLEGLRRGTVQYPEVRKLKRQLLYAAFKTFRSRSADKARSKAFADFEREHADWLPGYASHRALVSWHDECENCEQWPREHGSPTAVRVWTESLTPGSKRQFRDLLRYHAYVQWIAYSQWFAVRTHAEQEGVALMGDIPVGVSRHSTDVWGNPASSISSIPAARRLKRPSRPTRSPPNGDRIGASPSTIGNGWPRTTMAGGGDAPDSS